MLARWQSAGALLAVVLLVPWLLAFSATASFREPGLLPGGPDEPAFTLADVTRLRSQPAPPAITARSAIVWDATAGVELFSKAPDERIAPGSTVKMLTALLALELVPLDTRIAISPRDVSKPEDDESSMGLIAGEVLTTEDLLYGTLLASGGDAARALARVAGTTLLAGNTGDPMARFVQEMNGRVARWNLPNTRFANPDGGDAPDGYSSARDLLRIADFALKRPELAQIVATKTATRQTADGKRSFALRNTNELLFVREGVHGVKTGTTDGCGQCLVTAQWGVGGRLIAVVLGSTDRYADTTTLLDWVNTAYRWVPLGQGAELPGLTAALNRWQVTLRDRKLVVLQAWEVPSLRYQLLLEPSTSGDVRGKVVFFSARREVLSLPVYTR